jgi:hypothetical protein
MVEEFKLIFREVSPPKIIGMIIRGDNLFHVMKDLLNITNRVQLQHQEQKEVPAIKPVQIDVTDGLWAKLVYVGRMTKMIFWY